MSGCSCGGNKPLLWVLMWATNIFLPAILVSAWNNTLLISWHGKDSWIKLYSDMKKGWQNRVKENMAQNIIFIVSVIDLWAGCQYNLPSLYGCFSSSVHRPHLHHHCGPAQPQTTHQCLWSPVYLPWSGWDLGSSCVRYQSPALPSSPSFSGVIASSHCSGDACGDFGTGCDGK